ncbi:MAG: tetratricopeptide repeat protein [Planctomycetota bacterium]
MDAHRFQPINRNRIHPTLRRGKRTLVTLALGGLLTSSFGGCATQSMSLASLNPFKAPETKIGGMPETPSMLASTTGGMTKAASSIGAATKNAFSKTTGAVAGMFGRNADETIAAESVDPLSLQNKPDQIGPDVFVANGQLWESTGNVTKAMESYSKALAAEPDNGPALTSIARLHFREGNHPKAAEFFQKAIAKQPEDAALYNDMGLTLSKLGQHELASQTIARALQLAPGTSRYANNLASVHFDAKQPEKALKVLTENNKPAVAHFNMAYLHYKDGQTGDATKHLNLAMAQQGPNSDDPATLRAIERSREMLAQISPAGAPGTPGPQAPIAPGRLPSTEPATQIAATPRTFGAASGPAATVAMAPGTTPDATAPKDQPQRTFGSVAAAAAAAGGQAQPVSYKNPSSYMSPQLPAGFPGTTVATPASAKTPSATIPAGPASMATPPAPTTVPSATKPSAPMTSNSGAVAPSSTPAAAASSTAAPQYPFQMPSGFNPKAM